MADINLIKTLRDETGLSLDKIRAALEEAENDADKARELLAAQAGEAAAKKADREAKDGIIGSYVHGNGKIGAMVLLACETDFVARNDDFTVLAKDLAMHASAMRPENAEAMLEQPFVKDPSKTVRDHINQSIAKLGENIQLTDVAVLAIG